jgi:hypothetical protein
MNPFDVLLPEIWALIRGHLQTSLNARDRVSLQRTCKAAARLDGGVILAPAWAKIKAILTENVSPHMSWRQQTDLWDAMKDTMQVRLWDETWVPSRVKAIASVVGPAAWVMGVQWVPVPWMDVTIQYRRLDAVKIRWEYRLAVFKEGGERTPESKVAEAITTTPSLVDLMNKVPLLGMGYHPQLIKIWVAQGKLVKRVIQ